MEKIIEGTIKFMEEDFFSHQDLFKNLANKQSPHSLFIGCVDSRVVSNLITNTLPGELFAIRNIANIVPPYRASQDYVATTSAIEYALYYLGIKNIIICGHSNCGGCEAIYYDEKKFEKIPNVAKWLKLLDHIKNKIEKIPEISHAKRAWLTERLNIVNSIENLFTFPHVKQWYENNEIKILGLHYIIETGEIFSYNINDKHFEMWLLLP